MFKNTVSVTISNLATVNGPITGLFKVNYTVFSIGGFDHEFTQPLWCRDKMLKLSYVF